MTNCPTSYLNGQFQALTLDRYQVLMRLPIAAFNGLNKPDETPVYECSTIWKQSERAALAMALAQAEEMREAELKYHLAPKYDVETLPFLDPAVLSWKYLVSLGVQTISVIQSGYTLSYTADPVVVTVATTVTDVSEIVVYYPGLDCTITPSKITVAGGSAVIEIPRSRLVKPNLLDDRDDHLSYYLDSNFLETVDIKRVYYDPVGAVSYNWYGLNSIPPSVSTDTETAYATILDKRLSNITHRLANYSSGTWSFTCPTKCRYPDSLTVYYLSGIQRSINTDMQTIRLAHTLMPNKPVSCPTVQQMWQEDVERTKNYTPYGDRYGALQAWLADSRAKVGHGGKFPSIRQVY